MIFKVNTQTVDDPNTFGELLREYCFKEEYGRYSCFELIDGFKPINKCTELGYSMLLHLGYPTHEENKEASIKGEYWKNESKMRELFGNPYLENGCQLYQKPGVDFEMGSFTINIGWYWDGDGILVIQENNRIAYNSDCKTDHDWSWIKE